MINRNDKKESKHTTKVSHQTTKEESKGRRKKQIRTAKTARKIIKMAISKYLSIIILNVKGLNS